jgi:hypothetical protein
MLAKIQGQLIAKASLQFRKLRSHLGGSVKSIKDWALFIYDYLATSLNDSHTSRKRTYQLMRLCYSLSQGKSANLLSIIPQLIHPARPSSSASISSAVLSLNNYGFYKLEKPSSQVQALCKNLKHELSSFTIHEVLQGFKEGAVYSSIDAALKDKSRIGARLNHQRNDVSSCLFAWQLIEVLNLPDIASHYLKCRPVITSLDSWYVAPIDNSLQAASLYSAAAQTYHYDMDWIKFLKFFVNLTEVKEYHGPFEFILGSHKKKDKRYFKDGRFEELYGESAIIKATGPAGSMLAADTSGIHRDGRAIAGFRQVLQVEFAVSSFGAKFQYDDLFRKCHKSIPWDRLPSKIAKQGRLLRLFREA